MKISTYFASLGYKWSNRQKDYIVKDFQRHCGLVVDGIIGQNTRKCIRKYNSYNFCPEVFEPIKPYIPYSDNDIGLLMKPNLMGYGYIFNKESKKNNFDVLHNIGHAVLEGSYKGKWANSYIARIKNNTYGFGAYDLSPVTSAKKFESLKQGIEVWSKWWNENYLEPWGVYYHGNCEKGVNYKYASSGIAGINKAFIVRDLRRKLWDN